MKKKQIIFIIFIILIALLTIISGILLLRDSKEISRDDFLNLIEEDYSIVDFNQINKNGSLIVSGELDKDAVLSLSKQISKHIKLDIIKVLVFNNQVDKIDNGFYVDGLTNEVTIRNKSKNIKIAEFKDIKIDTTAYDITLEDAKYNDVKNIDGIAYIDITSNTLTKDNYKEQLYLLAKIIHSDNKDIKNVIITANINNTTYGISLNNPDKLKLIESYDL